MAKVSRFPKEFKNDVQVAIFVLSHDQENDADILGALGASAAVSISDIPFDGPVASVRVGKIGDELILNPTADHTWDMAKEHI